MLFLCLTSAFNPTAILTRSKPFVIQHVNSTFSLVVTYDDPSLGCHRAINLIEALLVAPDEWQAILFSSNIHLNNNKS